MNETSYANNNHSDLQIKGEGEGEGDGYWISPNHINPCFT